MKKQRLEEFLLYSAILILTIVLPLHLTHLNENNGLFVHVSNNWGFILEADVFASPIYSPKTESVNVQWKHTFGSTGYI